MGPRRNLEDPKDVVISQLAPDEIGELAVVHLAASGFCIIDGGFDSELLQKAQEDVLMLDERGKFRRPPELITEGLLGPEGSSRVADLDEASSHEPESVGPSLRGLDQAMGDMAGYVEPWVRSLGFESHLRSFGVVHETGPPDSWMKPLTEEEASKWLPQLMRGMVLCMICLGPDTGILELCPYDEEAETYEIETGPGTFILTRADSLAAVHRSRGRSHILTCFFLNDRSPNDKRNIHTKLTPAANKLNDWVMERLRQLKDEETDERRPEAPREWLIAMNHQCFKGQHMSIRGMSIRAAMSWLPDTWFRACFGGVDYMTEVPLMRWDHGNFYDPEPEAWRVLKTYTKHVSVIDGADLFDNRMFGITPAESKTMDPQQRVVLEAGYDALFDAGYRKGQIMNSLGGMYLGYGTANSDFSYVERSADASGEASFGATGGSAAITANRFSFCLGMKGPSIAVDAEDASSLVAVHMGCEALQAKGRGQRNEYSLVGGIKLNLAAYYWPQKQAAGLMSQRGRCFTFHAGADGFVQGDGCCHLAMKALTEVVDGEVILKDLEKSLGVVSGTAVNCNGRNASMSAPHGPSEQEVINMALRGAALSGFDLDAAECHGAGGFLSDAVEVSSWMRVLRLAEDAPEPLGFMAAKSSTGNMCQGTGVVSLMKIAMGNSWGAMMPNVHLGVVNPHIEAWEQPMNFVTEVVEFKMASSYAGTLARGFGGTNATAIAWGKIDYEKVQAAPEPPERERLVFWPGGGGNSDEAAVPRRGFHIAGTFTRWEPAQMDPEGNGVYGYTVTLSENRWEQFQIWLDGDSKRCLYPEKHKASKKSRVNGPDARSGGHTWHIEGRTWLMPYDEEESWQAEPQDGALAVPSALAPPAPAPIVPASQEDAGVVAIPSSAVGGRLYEYGTLDRGLVGAKYRVRLHTAGKWRMVDWERLSGKQELEIEDAVEAARALPQSEYAVTADWNGWGFSAMQEVRQEGDSAGVFVLDVHLIRSGGEFQIIRNRDWEQVIYPLAEMSGCQRPQDVGGPDDDSNGRTWYLDGDRGDTFRIEFQRSTNRGLDQKKVTFRKTGRDDLSEEQLQAASRVRYAVFGSWDDGTRLRELKWTGDKYVFYVELGGEAKESFQLVQNLDWDRIFHPSVANANPSIEYEIQGPSLGDGKSRGLNWTIGTEGYEKAEDVFEVSAYPEGRGLRRVDWVQITGADLHEAEAEGLVLRRRRR